MPIFAAGVAGFDRVLFAQIQFIMHSKQDQLEQQRAFPTDIRWNYRRKLLGMRMEPNLPRNHKKGGSRWQWN